MHHLKLMQLQFCCVCIMTIKFVMSLDNVFVHRSLKKGNPDPNEITCLNNRFII